MKRCKCGSKRVDARPNWKEVTADASRLDFRCLWLVIKALPES